MADKSSHSICRWTFNPGKGGFVPGDMSPEWGGKFGTPEMIKLTAGKIRPRMPDNIELGIEMHYDSEVDDKNAAAVADALVDSKLYPAMITPGAHSHFVRSGITDTNTMVAVMTFCIFIILILLLLVFAHPSDSPIQIKLREQMFCVLCIILEISIGVLLGRVIGYGSKYTPKPKI